MKYVCMINEDDDLEIITFPRNINHDVMADALSRLKNQTHGAWHRVSRTPLSAGFVDVNGNCFGESETLGLESRGMDDTTLLAEQRI